MNKSRFRLLVFLMSLSLIGIIVVQLYWITTSLNKNEEEFKYHVQQVLGNVSNAIKDKELVSFYKQYNKIKDSIGTVPKEEDLKEIYFYERDKKTNETIIYSNTLVAENYGITGSFFDKNTNSVNFDKVVSKRKTEIYNGNSINDGSFQMNAQPNVTIKKSGSLSSLDKANFEVAFKDIVSQKPLQQRISNEELEKLLKTELNKYGVKTPFEFGIYSNGLATKIRSDKFKYDKKTTYGIPVFQDNEGLSQYQLLVGFPHKSKFVFSSLIGITSLSLLFTLVIVLTYSSALNQLIKQKQISEIKTDFINNMTHEFKTPIATINLALDAIKNPKIIDDKEKVQRYLQMIKEENKRMHAQVENVLRISKLEKNELDISKEPRDVSEIIEDAIDIDDTIIEISSNPKRSLEEFFKPLDNQEYHFVELSKQKGRKNYLRLFAIKIDNNCFVITGGAIKFHHLNKDRPHTQKEMQKINRCRDYLKDNGVFDADSFYEFLNEQK